MTISTVYAHDTSQVMLNHAAIIKGPFPAGGQAMQHIRPKPLHHQLWMLDLVDGWSALKPVAFVVSLVLRGEWCPRNFHMQA